MPIDLLVPRKPQFDHTVVIAPSRSGKTLAMARAAQKALAAGHAVYAFSRGPDGKMTGGRVVDVELDGPPTCKDLVPR